MRRVHEESPTWKTSWPHGTWVLWVSDEAVAVHDKVMSDLDAELGLPSMDAELGLAPSMGSITRTSRPNPTWLVWGSDEAVTVHDKVMSDLDAELGLPPSMGSTTRQPQWCVASKEGGPATVPFQIVIQCGS